MPKTASPRSELRIADLKSRSPTTSRIINLKVPVHIADAISNYAASIGATKTEIIVALLNAGLERAGKMAGLPRKRKQGNGSSHGR